MSPIVYSRAQLPLTLNKGIKKASTKISLISSTAPSTTMSNDAIIDFQIAWTRLSPKDRQAESAKFFTNTLTTVMLDVTSEMIQEIVQDLLDSDKKMMGPPMPPLKEEPSTEPVKKEDIQKPAVISSSLVAYGSEDEASSSDEIDDNPLAALIGIEPKETSKSSEKTKTNGSSLPVTNKSKEKSASSSSGSNGDSSSSGSSRSSASNSENSGDSSSDEDKKHLRRKGKKKKSNRHESGRRKDTKSSSSSCKRRASRSRSSRRDRHSSKSKRSSPSSDRSKSHHSSKKSSRHYSRSRPSKDTNKKKHRRK